MYPNYDQEVHNLPNTKEGNTCWLEIKHFPDDKLIYYHYTHNNGCYIIECVHYERNLHGRSASMEKDEPVQG